MSTAVEKLLDEGFIVLEKFSSLKRVRNPDGRGTHLIWRPQIRAKYGERRRWYVLEKGFATPEARDQRVAELLQLPKYIEHTYL